MRLPLALLAAMLLAAPAFAPAARADVDATCRAGAADAYEATWDVVGDRVYRSLMTACLAASAADPASCSLVAPQSPACDFASGAEHGTSACTLAHAALTLAVPLDPRAHCMLATSLGASVAVGYTQVTASCWPNAYGGETCLYEPTFHARLETLAPGNWVLRASTLIRAYGPAGAGPVVPGSERVITCTAGPEPGACSAQEANVDLTAGNTNAFGWEATWTLSFVDASGSDHVQATGTDGGWLAQYYSE